MSRSVTALEFEAETLPAEEETLRSMTEDIIAQWAVSAKSSSKFARYLKEKSPDQFQTSALTVEKRLKHWSAWETEELQKISTKAVRE